MDNDENDGPLSDDICPLKGHNNWDLYQYRCPDCHREKIEKGNDLTPQIKEK